MPRPAILGPFGELDLGDQPRPHPGGCTLVLRPGRRRGSRPIWSRTRMRRRRMARRQASPALAARSISASVPFASSRACYRPRDLRVELIRVLPRVGFRSERRRPDFTERSLLVMSRSVAKASRRALGHRPALENAVDLQPEIVMQMRCPMFLHHKDVPPAGASRPALRLRRRAEITFLPVGRQQIRRPCNNVALRMSNTARIVG